MAQLYLVPTLPQFDAYSEPSSVDDVIADQILANCNSLRLKERILREEKADLTFILKQDRILECSKQQASHISAKNKSAEINAIRGGWKPGIRNSGIRQQQESKRESAAKCRNCGQKQWTLQKRFSF